MNTFKELCINRRSYRKYTDQPIARETLEEIMQCALMSPAGKRLNPWEFVVVEDRGILTKMADCRSMGSQMLAGAQAGIVVCADPSICDTWLCDASIAAQNILLAATDLGLGACWCHIYSRENADRIIKDLTGIPDNLTILCVISLGHKNEERKPFNLEKLQYNKVHYGKY